MEEDRWERNVTRQVQKLEFQVEEFEPDDLIRSLPKVIRDNKNFWSREKLKKESSTACPNSSAHSLVLKLS
jgi:hypothetical protein